MSIIASKTCAAKSAAKLDTFFELHNTFPTLFLVFFVLLDVKKGASPQDMTRPSLSSPVQVMMS
jgi:hypothetical protein